MNCEEVMELMQRDLDQDLNGQERESMLAHIGRCPECAAMYDRLRKLSAELEAMPAIAPPFSIVDSILPRLAELGDAQQQQGASAERRAAASSRRERGPFSWKIAGGVAAAAIVIGLVLFNQNGSLKFNADTILPGGQKSASSGAAPRQDAAAQPASGGSAAGNADKSKDTASVSPPFPNAVPEPQATAAQDELAAPKFSEPLRQEGSPSKSAVPNQLSPSSKVPAGSTRKSTGGDQYGIASAPSSSGSSSGIVEPPKASGDNQVTFQPNQGGPVPVAPPAAGSGGGASARTFGAPEENTAMGSESGKYKAVIEQQRIRIHSGSDVVYASKQWGSGDTLGLVSWNRDTQFVYEVRLANGTVQQYTIDLVFHTEIKK